MTDEIAVVAYDPSWPGAYVLARDSILALVDGETVLAIEHVGSTAVPGLAAKPIIDIMLAVADLPAAGGIAAAAAALGYVQHEIGMRNRIFLHRDAPVPAINLHVVLIADWPSRKERLMRDHLLAHPDEARAYGRLKSDLARQHPGDLATYTRAKTDFIQGLLDRARAARGLPPAPAWEE